MSSHHQPTHQAPETAGLCAPHPAATHQRAAIGFTAYSLRLVLRECVQGRKVAGYTTKPGCGLAGLHLSYALRPRGRYVGFGF